MYSAGLVGLTEGVYYGGKAFDPTFPMHIEVLLPAFVVGCMLARPVTATGEPAPDPLETPTEERAGAIVAAIFMLCVGLSIPLFRGSTALGATEESYTAEYAENVNWTVIAFHVLVITVLSNLGKMFPALCYRREAPWRERLALAVALWPRGEVGAGVLVLSISYGIGGPIMIVAILSLALNLVLTGVFIAFIKTLLVSRPELYPEMRYAQPTAPR
jgi:Kef-type K+ transport system membrane component KefB